MILSVSDSTFFIKNEQKVQKWEKVSFDGIFEFPIDNLLSIE